MCKSRREGGQRCFAHAWKRYQVALAMRALTPYDLKDPARMEAETLVHARLLELASTPKGAEMVAAKRDKRMDGFDRDYLESVLRQGAELAERNKALGALTRDERTDMLQTRGSRIAKALAPAVVPLYSGGHAIAVSDNVAVQIAAGAGAALVAGLSALKARNQERYRPWLSPRETELRTALRIEKDDEVIAERRARTPDDADDWAKAMLKLSERHMVQARAGQDRTPDVRDDSL